MEKKLYKSSKDRKLCGVCGGLAEYLNIDPTIIRLIWVILVLFAGTGILAYIIAALVIPEQPEEENKSDDANVIEETKEGKNEENSENN